jgi:hypothetical protein
MAAGGLRPAAFALFLGAALFTQATGRAPAADGPRIVALVKSALIATAAGIDAAKAGATIPSGATLSTDGGNTATVAMPDGVTIEVGQKSSVLFDGADGWASIRLVAGTIRLSAPQRAHDDLQPFSVKTELAQVTFRAQTGYVTAGSTEAVVTCIRCARKSADRCESNDFFVHDVATCVGLTDAAVATVSRQYGIKTRSSSQEAMVQTVIASLSGQTPERPAGGFGALGDTGSWWSSHPGELGVDHKDVALSAPGETTTLTVTPEDDSGAIHWLATNPNVAVADAVPGVKNACTVHAVGAGNAAIVMYDQLGRYVAVPVTVSQAAAR